MNVEEIIRNFLDAKKEDFLQAKITSKIRGKKSE